MNTKPSILAVLLLAAFANGEEVKRALAPLPSDAATLVNQYEAFEQRTRKEAERTIYDGRALLITKLTDAANKARSSGRAGEAVNIDAHLAALRETQQAAAAPAVNQYASKEKISAGYYNNDPRLTLEVENIGKKRTLVMIANQDAAKTNGDIFIQRPGAPNETRVGAWKAGMPNPLTFDISGSLTKPGPYVLRLHYKDGGDMFRVEAVEIRTEK